ncbi:hypothetical protein GCM10027200_19220 [Lentzea nigeriaca]
MDVLAAAVAPGLAAGAAAAARGLDDGEGRCGILRAGLRPVGPGCAVSRFFQPEFQVESRGGGGAMATRAKRAIGWFRQGGREWCRNAGRVAFLHHVLGGACAEHLLNHVKWPRP